MYVIIFIKEALVRTGSRTMIVTSRVHNCFGLTRLFLSVSTTPWKEVVVRWGWSLLPGFSPRTRGKWL